jgi:hypothetical protein
MPFVSSIEIHFENVALNSSPEEEPIQFRRTHILCNDIRDTTADRIRKAGSQARKAAGVSKVKTLITDDNRRLLRLMEQVDREGIPRNTDPYWDRLCELWNSEVDNGKQVKPDALRMRSRRFDKPGNPMIMH